MDKAEDTEWRAYRSRLIPIYFNNNAIASLDSPLHAEFRLFLSRFENKMPKGFWKKSEKLKESVNEFNEKSLSMEPHYDPVLKIHFPLKLPTVDSFLTRDMPDAVVNQFVHIVQLFISFINKREGKKIDQIRNTQAALPIAKSRDEILACLKKNQVMLLAGDTGCGKSTQLPQYLLQDGYNKIACTQPRRIATMALAKRVGEEMLNPFGTDIAFQTRFEKSKSQKTRLLFLTDGLLIRQMGIDPLLSQYDVIILDEVHERHVSGDLLVALMKIVVSRRSDLKLILMSATIQLDLFSSYFKDTPIIQVPGRLFPIELQYIPVKEHDLEAQKKTVKLDTGPYLKILQMIDKKYPKTERGDLLIFLNGISEMSILAEALKEYAEFSKRWIVLMLHSTLSVEEQNKVFDIAPPNVRKAIISTNIAETSVTIDEIRFVVDSGKVNLIRYDGSTHAQRLCECWVSKASAEQRKGRAGRTGPGVCYRLYSSEQYEKMEDFTLPEIKRVSLESLAMQILNMDLKIDVRDFPFLEAPNMDSLNQVLESLKCQNIVNVEDSRTLTPMGQILANLPVDIVVGKMLIYGVIFDQIDVVLTIAASLSVQSAFTQRSFREFDCVQNRQRMISDIGDPFTLIRVYKDWVDMQRTSQDTKKWARTCGIEETRLYEIIKLRRQFKQILEQSDLLSTTTSKEWDNLSSRERKIKVGEKRKLFKLKEKARNETRKRRILKEGRHFDTIVDEDAETTNPQDDINSLEFQVLVNDNDARSQTQSHKMNEERSVLLKFIIAIGLYPQYAVEDAHNNHQQAKEQFAHTASKPFTILHPNSVLGQAPECLSIDKDHDGFSCDHQIIFFGLLLETTKPFLCNTTRIPALFLMILARNISYTSNQSISLDGFVELTFRASDVLESVINKAVALKIQITNAVNDKLSGSDIADVTRSIQKRLVEFAHFRCEFKMRRFVHVPRIIESGIFGLDGLPILAEAAEEDEQFEVEPFTNDVDLPNEECQDDKSLLEEASKKKTKMFYCDICRREFSFSGNVDILRHKNSHN